MSIVSLFETTEGAPASLETSVAFSATFYLSILRPLFYSLDLGGFLISNPDV